MQSLCIGNESFRSCIIKNRFYKRVSFFSKPIDIQASKVIGYLPAPSEDDKVIILANPPDDINRIVLKEGAWFLLLPSRSSLLKSNFITMFTLMTNPGNRIIRSDIFEFELDTSKSNFRTMIEKLKQFYGERIEVIELKDINTIKTSNYKIYKDKEKRWIIFEPKI